MGRSLLTVALGFMLMLLSPRLLFLVTRQPGESTSVIYEAAYAFAIGYLVGWLGRRAEMAHAVVVALLLVPVDIIAILLASGRPLSYLIVLALSQIVALLAGAGVRARQARSAGA